MISREIHRFKVNATYLESPDGVAITVNYEAKESTASIETTYVVQFESFSIKVVSRKCSGLEGIKSHSYDEDLFFSMTNGTWEHNLLATTLNCSCLHSLENDIAETFEHVVNMVNQGRSDEIVRYPIWAPSDSVCKL